MTINKICKDLDYLHYRLMRAKEFIPHKIGYYEKCITEHIKICPVCQNNK